MGGALRAGEGGIFFRRGDLLLLVTVVRVDSILEAHVREENESLPLAPLESIGQVRRYSISIANSFPTTVRCSVTNCRREASSSGELNQAITPNEWIFTEGNRFGCKLDIFELGAELECAFADGLEVFVADDAFEGGAFGENQLFNDCELIGESDALEGGATCERCFAYSFEFFVANDAFEGGAIGKNHTFDDFELIRESDTREGVASMECPLP